MAVPPIATPTRPVVARSALVTEATGAPVPGGRSTGGLLRPRDAAPTIGSVPGYSFLGCYVDVAAPRIFPFTWRSDMTQCFCGSQMEATASNRLAPPSDCITMCVGNDGMQCGAANRTDVYSATIDLAEQTTTAATPTPASLPGYSYLGCISDSTARLLKQTSFSESIFIDAEYCCSLCLNYDNGNVVCAVEDANQCFCGGQEAMSNALPMHAADCSTPCVGHGDQLCGGFYRLNLYSATAVVISESASSVSPTSSSNANKHTQPANPSLSPSSPGLHGGAIAGVVVGSVAGVALIAGLAYYMWHRRCPRRLDPLPPNHHLRKCLGICNTDTTVQGYMNWT